eukprot:1025298-Pyramimonas_sp.AAC.2
MTARIIREVADPSRQCERWGGIGVRMPGSVLSTIIIFIIMSWRCHLGAPLCHGSCEDSSGDVKVAMVSQAKRS